MLKSYLNAFIKTIYFVVISTAAFAQQGDYFLSHFTPSDERIDYLTFGMAQDAKGVIYFASKNGILEFDGRNWKLVGTSGPVFTITISGQDVFLGGLKGFGKITIGPDNTKSNQLLSENQPEAKQIFSSLAFKGKVYFANSHAIYVVTPASGAVESVIKAKPQEEFGGLFEVTGTIYIKSTDGIQKIEGNKLIPSNFPWPNNLTIDFAATSPTSHLTLLSVPGGRLFLANADGLKEINVADKDFLAHNIPIAANWLTDELVAIGTLRGGIIFINPQTGVTQEMSNFYSGLPDNEVYSMMVDRNQGLWVAHDYGFTRISPFMPFRSFSYYPGLEGNLLCAKTFHGETYVGTTLGLFVLVKQDVTEEIFISQSGSSRGKGSKKKKGLFSFLRKNTVEESETQNKKGGKYALKLSGYAYKRVAGIDGKVTQLIEHNNQLLAAGIFGVATIDAAKSTHITLAPVRYAYMSNSVGQLLVSTLEDEIKSFAPKAKGWQETSLLDTLNDYVSFIFEDKLQNIWLCGRTDAIKIETVDAEITAVDRVPFSNPTIDESVGIDYGNDVYVATGGSFHKYDHKDNVFKKYDSLPGPKKYFASAGYFWFHDGHRWRTVDPRKQAAFKLEWLGLFPNIRFIAPADNQSLWVITANNELYKFSSGAAQQYKNDYPLFLREVRGQQSKILPSHSIKVSQLENTVDFEFIQPDFLGMKAVEYRYQVKGLSKDWTLWASTNNIVNFSYLPTGKYKVEVQTRDLMGKISKVEEIALEVEPPYWRRPWFYLIEVIFFSAMVFLSMRLSAGNEKYRIISQLLSMLTIIMVIQLVNAAVNVLVAIKTNTPVLDFFVQVGIALLVLPFENTLRKFMAKARKAN
jgi:ligand-binding sensor domain-containing protein